MSENATKTFAQKAVLLDQENAQLKARIAELEGEDDTIVLKCQSLARKIEVLTSDLQAARTAAEIAQSHTNALEQLVRDYVIHAGHAPEDIVDVLNKYHNSSDEYILMTNDDWGNVGIELERRAKALLGEVKHA